MVSIKEYFIPSSLDEAYERLMKVKSNTVIGGMMWLHMSEENIGTAIDLSNLNLSYIQDPGDCIAIGAMTTLRQLETSALLKEYFGSFITDAVKPIVGTQFRNTATIGGSVFGRYGFSDILTFLVALDAEVVLYKQGRMKLDSYLETKRQKDILIKILLKKEKVEALYTSIRKSKTDIPVVTAAVVKSPANSWRVVIGSTPNHAKTLPSVEKALEQNISAKSIQDAVALVSKDIKFQDNMRGSAWYREQVSKVMIERAIKKIAKLGDE